MNPTTFPATPADVVTLTVQEFIFDLDELDKKLKGLGFIV